MHFRNSEGKGWLLNMEDIRGMVCIFYGISHFMWIKSILQADVTK